MPRGYTRPNTDPAFNENFKLLSFHSALRSTLPAASPPCAPPYADNTTRLGPPCTYGAAELSARYKCLQKWWGAAIGGRVPSHICPVQHHLHSCYRRPFLSLCLIRYVYGVLYSLSRSADGLDSPCAAGPLDSAYDATSLTNPASYSYRDNLQNPSRRSTLP